MSCCSCGYNKVMDGRRHEINDQPSILWTRGDVGPESTGNKVFDEEHDGIVQGKQTNALDKRRVSKDLGQDKRGKARQETTVIGQHELGRVGELGSLRSTPAMRNEAFKCKVPG